MNIIFLITLIGVIVLVYLFLKLTSERSKSKKEFLKNPENVIFNNEFTFEFIIEKITNEELYQTSIIDDKNVWVDIYYIKKDKTPLIVLEFPNTIRDGYNSAFKSNFSAISPYNVHGSLIEENVKLDDFPKKTNAKNIILKPLSLMLHNVTFSIFCIKYLCLGEKCNVKYNKN